MTTFDIHATRMRAKNNCIDIQVAHKTKKKIPQFPNFSKQLDPQNFFRKYP